MDRSGSDGSATDIHAFLKETHLKVDAQFCSCICIYIYILRIATSFLGVGLFSEKKDPWKDDWPAAQILEKSRNTHQPRIDQGSALRVRYLLAPLALKGSSFFSRLGEGGDNHRTFEWLRLPLPRDGAKPLNGRQLCAPPVHALRAAEGNRRLTLKGPLGQQQDRALFKPAAQPQLALFSWLLLGNILHCCLLWFSMSFSGSPFL